MSHNNDGTSCVKKQAKK